MQLKRIKQIGAAFVATIYCSNVLAEPRTRPPSGEPAIRLESTITGDKEQPAVSYFVPWQSTQAPDKLQWNVEAKHDGSLQPVDRDVMLRSMNIYDEMKLENN